jgi:hypothetical protein
MTKIVFMFTLNHFNRVRLLTRKPASHFQRRRTSVNFASVVYRTLFSTKMAKTVEEINSDRDHLISRIDYCMAKMAGKLYPEDRTSLMYRLEAYVMRLMKLPAPKNAGKAQVVKEICQKMDGFVTAELEDNHKGCSALQDIRRRHRLRLRRQLKQPGFQCTAQEAKAGSSSSVTAEEAEAGSSSSVTAEEAKAGSSSSVAAGTE